MGPDPEEAVSDGMFTEMPWFSDVYVATWAVADAAADRC